MKRLVADIDDKLHTAIKMEALRQEKPTKQLVTEIIEEYLRKEEQVKSE